MELYLDDNFLVISKYTPEERKKIRQHFTFDDYSNAFAGGSFKKRNVKKVCLVKSEKKKYLLLRSGFIKDLLLFCKSEKIPVTIEDKRTRFPYQSKKYSNEELRQYFDPNFDYVDHQMRALQSLLKTNCGIIKAVTGSGKTEIIIALMQLTQAPTLIIVNKITLAAQTQERIQKAGLECGICYGKGIELKKNMISTIQSVKKMPDLHNYKMLILDEVHNAKSNTYQEFLKSTSYSLRFGFSATPEGNDKYKFALIKQYMGPILTEVGSKELIENKVIAKPKITFIEMKCPITMDWPSANSKAIVYNEERNNKIKDLVNYHNLPTLILIRNLDHGEALNEKIENSLFISGINNATERNEAVNSFKSGDIKTLISSNIFNEGISINEIRVLIIASGGKSKVETLQKLGRSLRLDKDKDEAIVYDFLDLNNKFTEKHSNLRKNIYKKAGFEVMWPS